MWTRRDLIKLGTASVIGLWGSSHRLLHPFSVRRAAAEPSIYIDCDYTDQGQSHIIDPKRFFGINKYPAEDHLAAEIYESGIRAVRENMFIDEILSPARCPDLNTWNSNKHNSGWINSLDWNKVNWLQRAKAKGFQTLALFVYMPSFLDPNPQAQDDPEKYPQTRKVPPHGDTARWTAWGEVCAMVFNHLKQYIDAVEIYNEPEYFVDVTDTGYGRRVDAAPDLYHYAAAALKPHLGGRPMGTMGTNLDSHSLLGHALETIPRDERTEDHPERFDYVGVHDYHFTTQEFYDRIFEARALLDETILQDESLWMTEWGPYWGGASGTENDVRILSNRTGMFGYLLTDFLRYGINNYFYVYSNKSGDFVDEQSIDYHEPRRRAWLAFKYAGITSASSVSVRHTYYGSSVPWWHMNTLGLQLPNGDRVVVTANNSAYHYETRWRLNTWPHVVSASPTLRLWQESSHYQDGPQGRSFNPHITRLNDYQLQVTLWVEPHTVLTFRAR